MADCRYCECRWLWIVVYSYAGSGWPQNAARLSRRTDGHVWTDGLDSVTHCDDSCHVISPLVINEMTRFSEENEQDLRAGSPTCPSVADTRV